MRRGRLKGKKKLYSVYDAQNDDVIVIDATAKKCAEILGIKHNSFRIAALRSRKGQLKKWEICERTVCNAVKKPKAKRGRPKTKELSQATKETVKAFVANGMSALLTAEKAHMTVPNVYYHLGQLKRWMKLDFRNEQDRREIKQIFGNTIWKAKG